MKPLLTKSTYLLLALAVILPASTLADTFRVTTQHDFEEAAEDASPGDIIELANGTWSDFEILFRGQGEEGKPITLRAEEKGKVIISGRSNLRMAGLIDANKMAACRGGTNACNMQDLMAFLSQNPGNASLAAACLAMQPGKGGITRGPGPAPMTWTDPASEQGVAFKEAVLPSASLEALKKSRLASIGTGIGIAFILVFALASVIALVYRFPIPFVGILSGPSAMFPAMWAVLFHVIIGGFIVLGFVGLFAGIIGHCWHLFGNRWVTIILLAAIGDTVLLLILASLDMIIGPW